MVSIPDPETAAREEVRLARRALKPPADVHEARKRLKRGRAFLRLCRRGSGGEESVRLRRALRDAGRELAGLRDREAVLEAIRGVDGETRVPPGLLAALRGTAEPDPGAEGEVFTRLRRELREVRRRVGAMEGGSAPPHRYRALGVAYRRARKAYLAAAGHPDADTLHTLRKRAKDLRYQLEWLSPAWPAVLGAWASELHALTDDLGRVQDVRVVRRAVAEAVTEEERRRTALLLWDLRRDGRRARRSALQRGRRLFAERPGSFTRRMRAVSEA